MLKKRNCVCTVKGFFGDPSHGGHHRSLPLPCAPRHPPPRRALRLRRLQPPVGPHRRARGHRRDGRWRDSRDHDNHLPHRRQRPRRQPPDPGRLPARGLLAGLRHHPPPVQPHQHRPQHQRRRASLQHQRLELRHRWRRHRRRRPERPDNRPPRSGAGGVQALPGHHRHPLRRNHRHGQQRRHLFHRQRHQHRLCLCRRGLLQQRRGLFRDQCGQRLERRPFRLRLLHRSDHPARDRPRPRPRPPRPLQRQRLLRQRRPVRQRQLAGVDDVVLRPERQQQHRRLHRLPAIADGGRLAGPRCDGWGQRLRHRQRLPRRHHLRRRHHHQRRRQPPLERIQRLYRHHRLHHRRWRRLRHARCQHLQRRPAHRPGPLRSRLQPPLRLQHRWQDRQPLDRRRHPPGGGRRRCRQRQLLRQRRRQHLPRRRRQRPVRRQPRLRHLLRRHRHRHAHFPGIARSLHG